MVNYIRNKKGFTLVEIIVVLVIIAILAATTLPALTGYINDARDKTAISEGRTALVAAQATASERRGTGSTAAEIVTLLQTEPGRIEINRLTGAGFTHNMTDVAVSQEGTVTAFELIVNNGRNVVYGFTSGFAIG